MTEKKEDIYDFLSRWRIMKKHQTEILLFQFEKMLSFPKNYDIF